MQVRTTRLGVAFYLAPDGPLSEEGLPDLEAAVRQTRAGGVVHLVFDLRHVPSCDSRGLEFLVDLSAALRAAGGSLRLAQPVPLCREILAVTRLDETIPVHEDLAGAARSFL
jgi:anti-sigma B factor antagonist